MINKEISVNICGDFYLNTLSPDENYFPAEILDIFKNSDLNIVNLECPVVNNRKNKIIKTGPNLSGSPHSFHYLKQIRTNLVTLANNHLMDFGSEGLSDTLSLCKVNSIGWVGAGMSREEAQRPYVNESGGIKISVLNFAENEWSTTSGNKPGANPQNIVENVRQIKKARESSDFVIVIIHGGHEFYHLPNPGMVSRYRFFAENGASVIIAHHPHCISGFEIYHNVPVFYSIGNFLFTMRSSRESWYTGLILNLRIRDDGNMKWELIPVRQKKDIFTLSLLDGVDKKNVLSDIDKYSGIIADKALLEEHWENFVKEWYDEKIDIFSPVQVFRNKKIIKLFQKTGLNRFFRTKKHYAQMLNHMRCESLSELTRSVMMKYLEM
jgi:poly-gamma-glutamate synthesis protein (capsule biosynthesis protein)